MFLPMHIPKIEREGKKNNDRVKVNGFPLIIDAEWLKRHSPKGFPIPLLDIIVLWARMGPSSHPPRALLFMRRAHNRSFSRQGLFHFVSDLRLAIRRSVRAVNLSVFFGSCLSSKHDHWSPATVCYRPTVMRSTQCAGVIIGFLVAPHHQD
jgi:hypothetical protein